MALPALPIDKKPSSQAKACAYKDATPRERASTPAVIRSELAHKTECAGILDIVAELQLADEKKIADGKQQLPTIVAMLVGLGKMT